VLTTIIPVFDLGMSFGEVESGNIYSKLPRNLADVSRVTFSLEFYTGFSFSRAVSCWV